MRLEDLQIYQLAMDIGERVWEIVVRWDYFAKDTVGKQLVKSTECYRIHNGASKQLHRTRKSAPVQLSVRP
jgi:hypothetical protein